MAQSCILYETVTRMPKYHILMGDIIRSRTYDARKLRRELMQIVSSCNRSLEPQILSPYTVTLGDEFQGIARSLSGLLESVFHFEETSIGKGLLFKIRYVGLFGTVDTPLNTRKAHGMMGRGLARARELLTNPGRGRPRFHFELPDPIIAKQLKRLFFAIDGIVQRWRPEDGALILDMIRNANNSEVGGKHDKDRSQIWKRRKHLLIEEYRALKDAVFTMA